MRGILTSIRSISAGIAGGLFLGASHAVWAILVWSGTAQPIMDFIFRLHMIKPAWVIEPFNLATAVALVFFTGAIGFVSGWFLAVIWNRLATPG
jgi:hypothetical protein